MTLLQSYLNNHGSAWFENNYAMNGGGIEMRDSSFVCLLKIPERNNFSEVMSFVLLQQHRSLIDLY